MKSEMTFFPETSIPQLEQILEEICSLEPVPSLPLDVFIGLSQVERETYHKKQVLLGARCQELESTARAIALCALPRSISILLFKIQSANSRLMCDLPPEKDLEEEEHNFEKEAHDARYENPAVAINHSLTDEIDYRDF